eukprot:687685-Amphidinium_carterae.1
MPLLSGVKNSSSTVCAAFLPKTQREHGHIHTSKARETEFLKPTRSHLSFFAFYTVLHAAANGAARLVDLAERMGKPIVSGERGRTMAEIQASAKEIS